MNIVVKIKKVKTKTGGNGTTSVFVSFFAGLGGGFKEWFKELRKKSV